MPKNFLGTEFGCMLDLRCYGLMVSWRSVMVDGVVAAEVAALRQHARF